MKHFAMLMLMMVSCSALADTTYHYRMDPSKRLDYVNYQALMTQCMKPATTAGLQPGSSGYIAFEASCNKTLDQVQDPETFEGKIPYQEQMMTNKGIGAELYEALTR